MSHKYRSSKDLCKSSFVFQLSGLLRQRDSTKHNLNFYRQSLLFTVYILNEIQVIGKTTSERYIMVS